MVSHFAPITSLDIFQFNHHGTRLVSGSSYGNLKIWDISTNKLAGSIKLETEVMKSHINKTEDNLCICGTDGVFLIDGVVHDNHNEYPNKLNITSKNMCFFKEEPFNRIVVGCDKSKLVVEDIGIYDDTPGFISVR